ncbi:cytochrome P450 734A6 [Elaeis guineensis]|uniref:Cytochrome P450 734A6 n=1 Tax=Elaeis guineensis var. tenera TaxID=51953 RepID=A0A6I9RFP4_ELAGV|nr:cytochrome P450 734A6 [Elaeis guineensis]
MGEMVGWCWKWFLPLGSMVVCIAMALRLLDFLWWRPKRLEEHFSKQGIRGPPYRFFIGCVKEMVGLMLEASSKPMMPQNSHNILPRVLSFYHHWKKIYGSTFLLWFGPTARLTVADPDLIREILVSRANYFERYESHPLVRQLEGDGLVSLRGEKWAHHRKVLTPTFHMDNLELLMPLVGRTVLDMVEKWSAMSPSGEVEIDVSEWFQTVTEDAITRTAFGRSYEDGKAVFRLQTQQMIYAAEAFRKVFIPGYRFLPTKKNTSSWKLDKEIKKNLMALIGRRKESSENEKPDGSAKDLLGLMINASTKKAPSPSSSSTSGHRRPTTTRTTSASPITVQDIVEECKTFLFAGKQTTSNLLTWATVLLAMHPEWQERARREVLEVCGSRDIPTRDHLAKLKTLGMILNETLRLYPPAVATIRRTKTDVELGGYRIPRGTELLIPIMAVHHDARLWGKDAAQFNPARFAEGPASAARHRTAFIPFGLGARMCIGQNLALLEAKLTVAIILQHFVVRLSPSYVHAPTVLMLLYPQYGAPLLFRSLSPPSPSLPSDPHHPTGVV